MTHQSRDRLIGQAELFATACVPRLALGQRIAFTVALWRQRIETRRYLAEMDARSLRDAGISPAAAAYESGKPFWQKMGGLR